MCSGWRASAKSSYIIGTLLQCRVHRHHSLRWAVVRPPSWALAEAARLL